MYIPAVCEKCGLVFSSGIGCGLPSSGSRIEVTDCWSQCPRCHSDAPILDGYFETLNGILTLIEGPEFTRSVVDLMAQQLLLTHRKAISPAEAVKNVTVKNKIAGSVFRECLTIGVAFTGVIISALGLYLDQKERGTNRSPEELIIESVEQVVATVPQPDLRPVSQASAPRLGFGARVPSLENVSRDYGGPDATGKASAKNRKMRRSEKAEARRNGK